MKHILACAMALSVSLPGYANDFFPIEFNQEVFNTSIHVGTYAPRVDDRATVIYLHGYADTMNNHGELLAAFHSAGMRVLAFDYPSHGKSGGQIWFWDLKQVAEITGELLNSQTFTDGPLAINRQLPVILVGWSTGATIAVRTAQSWLTDVIPADMRLAGIIGFAPGLPARALVGDGFSRWGIKVKGEDLTRRPEAMKYPPYPQTTVLGSGFFAASLKTNSGLAYYKGAVNVPTLMLIADHNKDFFADANSSAFWVNLAGPTLPTYGFQCRGAYHGVEFEPDGIGDLTRLLAVEFAELLAQPNPEQAKRQVEKVFRNRDFKICPQVHQN